LCLDGPELRLEGPQQPEKRAQRLVRSLLQGRDLLRQLLVRPSQRLERIALALDRGERLSIVGGADTAERGQIRTPGHRRRERRGYLAAILQPDLQGPIRLQSRGGGHARARGLRSLPWQGGFEPTPQSFADVRHGSLSHLAKRGAPLRAVGDEDVRRGRQEVRGVNGPGTRSAILALSPPASTSRVPGYPRSRRPRPRRGWVESDLWACQERASPLRT